MTAMIEPGLTYLKRCSAAGAEVVDEGEGERGQRRSGPATSRRSTRARRRSQGPQRLAMAPPISGPKNDITSAVMRRAATPKERKTESRRPSRTTGLLDLVHDVHRLITERNAPETPNKASRSETIAPAVNSPLCPGLAMLKSWSSSRPTTSFGSTIRACSLRESSGDPGATKRPSRRAGDRRRGKVRKQSPCK